VLSGAGRAKGSRGERKNVCIKDLVVRRGRFWGGEKRVSLVGKNRRRERGKPGEEVGSKE
jgi:hypothetical protein